MEEDPKDHDFDQRHDGPFDRPSVQFHRSVSDPNDAPHASASRTKSLPVSPEGVGRRSLHKTRSPSDGKSPPARTSTQMSRSGRASRDWDQRRDGPFGRPSLTMERRRSSGLSRHAVGAEEQAMSPVASPVAALPAEREKEEQTPTDQTPPSVEPFQSTTDPAFEPEPPPLNYLVWPRKWRILGFWSLIVLDCIGMPIGLYFGLRYHTNLSDNTVFSIVTAALGGVSIVEYFLRFWRLFKHNSTCRPIGARRMYLDFFHWNFSFGWFIIMLELIM